MGGTRFSKLFNSVMLAARHSCTCDMKVLRGIQNRASFSEVLLEPSYSICSFKPARTATRNVFVIGLLVSVLRGFGLTYIFIVL